MPDILLAADEALKGLSAILTKSASDLVSEAALMHDESIKYDKIFSDAVAKAAMPEQFMKKPAKKKMVDGKEVDDDADCDDAEKAEVARDLAKSAHEVVNAYFESIGDEEVTKGEQSVWAPLLKKVREYHASVNSTLEKQLDDYRKRAKAHRETMSKADNDEAKGVVTAQADELDALVKCVEGASTFAKSIATIAAWPRPDKQLDEPMKLEKPVDLGKGADWMPIQSKGELMGAVERYKQVPLGDQPPVYAHIFNAAAALGQKLPEGWHAPVKLEQAHSARTGSDQTARWKNISEADKKAAMAKGVKIVGPTGQMLGLLRAINGSTLIENMTTQPAAEPEQIAALKDWIKKGEEMLKGIIAVEAESIRMLDLPTFPEAIVKADHWANVAAAACLETLSDDMPVERRAMRKELSGRLGAAATAFLKAAGAGDLSKSDNAETLKAVETERDALKVKLEKMTADIIPLTRAAQQQKESLKKAQDDLRKSEEEIARLKAEPREGRGRIGAGGKIEKGDDGKDLATGEEGTADQVLAKATALPPGAARGDALLQAAHRMRVEEDED